MARVTPEDIITFRKLYARYGNYAQVGRETGFSGSTVSKYIRMDGVDKKIIQMVDNLLLAKQ